MDAKEITSKNIGCEGIPLPVIFLQKKKIKIAFHSNKYYEYLIVGVHLPNSCKSSLKLQVYFLISILMKLTQTPKRVITAAFKNVWNLWTKFWNIFVKRIILNSLNGWNYMNKAVPSWMEKVNLQFTIILVTNEKLYKL